MGKVKDVPQTKVVKVSSMAIRGFWTRPFYVKSMERVIADHIKKGWRHVATTPVATTQGRTTHYLLTFEKD